MRGLTNNRALLLPLLLRTDHNVNQIITYMREHHPPTVPCDKHVSVSLTSLHAGLLQHAMVNCTVYYNQMSGTAMVVHAPAPQGRIPVLRLPWSAAGSAMLARHVGQLLCRRSHALMHCA